MHKRLPTWWRSRPWRLAVPILAMVWLVACNPLDARMGMQGQLTDAAGQPVADGTYDAMFRLYRTSSSTTAVYTETKTITVQGGVFDTAIGVSPTITPSLLSEATWLEVSINGEVLSPRQRLLGAPYASALVAGSVSQGSVRADAFQTPGGAENVGSVFVGLNLDGTADGGSGLAGITSSDNSLSAGVYGAALGGSGYGGWFTSESFRGLYARGGNGNPAAFFAGDISVVGNCNGCNLAFVAQNAGDETLQPGDVLTVLGVAMDTENGVPVVQVRKAQAGEPLIGVVAKAARRTPLVRGEFGPDSGGYDPDDGPVAPGGYLMVLVQGLAQVQVGAAQLPVGAWLAVGDGGNLLAAASPDGGSVLGRILSPADASGLAWVMVAPR